MSKRYSHALTIAFEVDSDDPDMPTLSEARDGLWRRYNDLMADDGEAEEALLSESPFDTYDREETA